MTKEHNFTTLAEIALLTPEEFERMLPDFFLWYEYARVGHLAGAVAASFDWFDDGRPGELHSVELNGELVLKGPAFEGAV